VILWHSPPFGIGRALACMLDWRRGCGVERLEEEYAESLGVSHAILLPSARTGISWALKAAIDSSATVLCPAFTCQVVHEAAVRSGAMVRLIDAAPGGFLMDPDAVDKASSGKYAVVLSEMYGYTYDLCRLPSAAGIAPAVRIVDMAMTVPSRVLLGRLAGSDFGVSSFGVGKCMYAGWGGMGFTHDASLAKEVRSIRESFLAAGGAWLPLKRALLVLQRTAMHQLNLYRLYRFAKALRDGLLTRQGTQAPTRTGLSERWKRKDDLSAEWRLPSSPVDRRLALHNLRQSEWYCRQRLALAARYHENLRDRQGITRPPSSIYPLSHYTLRVSAAARRLVQSCLWARGVAVGTIFDFPGYLSAEEFSNASLVASEVLNLPLNVNLSVADVDYISECVADCVTRALM